MLSRTDHPNYTAGTWQCLWTLHPAAGVFNIDATGEASARRQAADRCPAGADWQIVKVA